MKTLKQLTADYIIGNPGCMLIEIMVGTQSMYSSGARYICKLLKTMTDAGELTREGTPKSYTYTAGPNIMTSITGVKAPRKKPVSGRKGIKNVKHSIMEVRQLWVRAGDYRVEPGDTRYNSLWSYANSFAPRQHPVM